MKFLSFLIALAFLISPGFGRSTFTKEDGVRVMELAFQSHAGFEDQLRDYGSARFRNVSGRYLVSGKHRAYYICGEVKSKNGFGGYADWTGFVITPSPRPDSVSVELVGRYNLDAAQFILHHCEAGQGATDGVDYSHLLYRSMTQSKLIDLLTDPAMTPEKFAQALRPSEE